MTSAWTIVAVALAAALVGAAIGGRRLLALAVGTSVAAAVTPWAAPVLARLMVERAGWQAWVASAAAWSIAYAATFWLASFVFMRLSARGDRSRKPSTAGRLAGGTVGLLVGGTLGWLALGNLSDLVVERLPEDASPAIAAIRRPFEITRACRVLVTMSPAEAELLTTRRDVTAVIEAEPLDRLLRSPGIVRKVSRACEGDWSQLATLASDPEVKRALTEPEFLRRIRAVDLVTLADDLERIRAGDLPAGEYATARDADAPLRPSDPRYWERRLAQDPEFRNRVVEEWFAHRNEDDDESPAGRPSPADRAARSDAYWRNIAGVLEWTDGPSIPTGWLPGADLPDPATKSPRSRPAASDRRKAEPLVP